MSNAAKVGLFLLVIWAFGFVLLGVSNASRSVREWYVLLPFLVPIALIVILQIAVWVGEFLERLIGHKI